MDYEKKYKEALEIARQFSEHPLREDSSTIVKYIFPELKESEDVDKKIREEIIATIHLYYGKPLEDEAKEMIAWLEKQGEKNPTDEEMKTILRTEYEKGRADVLRCIDPDEMVADFCYQPLSKTRSIASIYRQGIIDIVKRIDNNEKTSITGTRSIDDSGVR